jgi:tRNA(Arg) A34 adenosine deaminase TadA
MGRHRLTATITDKHGNVLAKAENSYNKTHPIQARFANSTNQPDRVFLHAEIAALVKLKRTDKPYRISIERVKRDGTKGLSKPCVVCEAAIKHWGINHVEYTI